MVRRQLVCELPVMSGPAQATGAPPGPVCPVCGQAATKRCSRCKSQWYCCVEHQRGHWRVHRVHCDDAVKADGYTMHKVEFDRIVKKYGLDSDSRSGEIAEYLTTAGRDAETNSQPPPQEGGPSTQTHDQQRETTAEDAADSTTPAGGQPRQVSPEDFAGRFGMTVEEAAVFLGWIKVGVQFKEQAIDAAQRSGFGKTTPATK
jgi:hypothetical protein